MLAVFVQFQQLFQIANAKLFQSAVIVFVVFVHVNAAFRAASVADIVAVQFVLLPSRHVFLFNYVLRLVLDYVFSSSAAADRSRL